MRLIVGLGNPGPKYEGNRHNIGFMAVDEIVRRHGFGPWRARFQGLVSEGALDGGKTLVLKPQTFMNESGRAVGEAMRFFKLDPADVWVIYDELDLAPAKVRVKEGGGHGGHNGLRSIDAHIGKDYRRVRLGIGHPGDKDRVHGYVLSDFGKEERKTFEKLIDTIATDIALLFDGESGESLAGRFMNKIAVTMAPPPRPKPQPKPENSPLGRGVAGGKPLEETAPERGDDDAT